MPQNFNSTKGSGIVIATANSTEIGKIAKSLGKAKKDKTQLQKRLNKLGWSQVIAAVVCAGIVLLGIYLWNTVDIYPEGLLVAISTAVAIVPEGLLPVVTLTLTLGMMRNFSVSLHTRCQKNGQVKCNCEKD